MELGTHNSMTYLKPKNWLLYPFRFIAKCQSLNVEELYKRGVRLFDIRISYTNNGTPEFRHGSMAYKGNVYEVLHWLNLQGEPIKIRILLETKKADLIKENAFIKDIRAFLNLYTNLTFYEGRTKYNWKQIIDLPVLIVEQIVGSMQGSKLNGLWPWLYAKKYNKENLEKVKDKEFVLIDFINIQ